METQISFLSEEMMDAIIFENQQADVYLTVVSTAGPKGDNDDDDDEKDTEANGTSTDDPPLDESVVHSLVTTQPGGRPKD